MIPSTFRVGLCSSGKLFCECCHGHPVSKSRETDCQPDHVTLTHSQLTWGRTWKTLQLAPQEPQNAICKEGAFQCNCERPGCQRQRGRETVSMRFKKEQDSTMKWVRGHSCYTVAKILAVFSQYPENFSEVKVKGNVFHCLLEIGQERNTSGLQYS